MRFLIQLSFVKPPNTRHASPPPPRMRDDPKQRLRMKISFVALHCNVFRARLRLQILHLNQLRFQRDIVVHFLRYNAILHQDSNVFETPMITR